MQSILWFVNHYIASKLENEKQNKITSWVDSERRAIGDGSVLAEEEHLVHHFAGGFFPTHVEMIFFHDAFVMLQQPHLLIGETFYALQNPFHRTSEHRPKKKKKPLRSNAAVQHDAS